MTSSLTHAFLVRLLLREMERIDGPDVSQRGRARAGSGHASQSSAAGSCSHADRLSSHRAIARIAIFRAFVGIYGCPGQLEGWPRTGFVIAELADRLGSEQERALTARAAYGEEQVAAKHDSKKARANFWVMQQNLAKQKGGRPGYQFNEKKLPKGSPPKFNVVLARSEEPKADAAAAAEPTSSS
ncbi:MAG: hypothetical protein JWO86_4171 [Myxococcaceae bacterium]|nr:hypothetical protein [Myxococcaceae bacterium]